MTTATEITDRNRELYTPVPAAAEGICTICHRKIHPSYEECWSCDKTTRQVSYPLRLVVPVSLSSGGDQYHHWLRTYKQEQVDETVRRRFGVYIAATLTRFLETHRGCIVTAAGSGWDCITHVPSSNPERTRHPFEWVLSMAPATKNLFAPLLRATGQPAITHNLAADAGFAPITEVNGRTVLLIDDTFTSGARMQSAASALTLAGATVVAGVPMGRYFNPRDDQDLQWWQQQRKKPFDFDRCCLD